MQWGINSARNTIGWVAGAGDVSSVCRAVCCSQGGVYSFEGVVCGFIPTAAFEPSVNDTLVVSENLEMNVGGAMVDEGTNDEFETNALGPTNVSVFSVPIWAKCPRAPPAVEQNSDACGAGIREAIGVVDLLGGGDG